MYHHSGNVAQQTAGSATGVLDPKGPETEAIHFQRCTWCGTAIYHRVAVCRGTTAYQRKRARTAAAPRLVHRNTPAARNVSLIEMARARWLRDAWPLIAFHSGDRVRLSTAKDPVRGEPVFQLVDEPYRLDRCRHRRRSPRTGVS
ncbi:hypothetical protein [Streptomyces sp. DHE17-7]|uniref:hypothetical protein n=1 Tax=Streptomyces sp. DHE17-7 TaxID=2759949 RepID=UPI0022EAC7C2|nr:hypothetical protein [Streptomyces sp. DHE17-7]MBJ6622970.1 hypothetical protein [Streptomyces sp. DHE17-7]